MPLEFGQSNACPVFGAIFTSATRSKCIESRPSKLALVVMQSPEVSHDGAGPLAAVICFVVKVLSVELSCLVPATASSKSLRIPTGVTVHTSNVHGKGTVARGDDFDRQHTPLILFGYVRGKITLALWKQ